MKDLSFMFAELTEKLGPEEAFKRTIDMIEGQDIKTFDELRDALEEELILIEEA